MEALDETLYDSEESLVDSDDSSVVDDIALYETFHEHTDSEKEESHISHHLGRDETFYWEEMDNYSRQREIFCSISGPQNEAKNVNSIVEIFQLFFCNELIEVIVEETNNYADQCLNSKLETLSPRSRVRSWKPVTDNEIHVMLALFMLMDIVRKPTLRAYFTRNSLLATPIFGSVMSLDRFEAVCRFLHFTNNNNKSTYQGPPKLFKIYPLICHLNKKFQSLFMPRQNITIDETFTLWKGQFSLKHYLPLKASHLGIKMFELSELHSGYLWAFIIHTGNSTKLESPLIEEGTNKTAAIVLKLVEPLLGRGHTLWMDSYYNSPWLAKTLKENHIDCVGTLNLNKKDVPKTIKYKRLKQGELIGQHSGPVSIIKWCGTKVITMISTFHNTETKTIIKKGKESEKPLSVIDYNQHMGSIDCKDEILQMCLVEREKMNKWYMKLFRRLLNKAVLNSMIIYRGNSRSKIDHLKFRIDLIKELLEKHGNGMKQNVLGCHFCDNTVPRLLERHFPERIPPTEKKARPQKRCVVCYKHGTRRDTIFWCAECEAGLCVEGCFKDYHTKLNF